MNFILNLAGLIAMPALLVPASMAADPATNAGQTATAAVPAGRPTAKPPTRSTRMLRKDEVLFNFQAADIQAVVKTVSQLTGRNFLLDPRVKGKVTIISAKPVSRNAAYQIFLSALKAQGFTAVSGAGGITKIVPVGEGKQGASTSPTVQQWGGDQMVTQVVVVQHGVATQLVPLLRPLMAPTSQLSAYAPANTLIITDYARNVRRLLKIIEEIDQPVSTEVTVIPLQHASALDLADLISRLQSKRPGTPAKGKAGAPGSGITIIPDLRTNSLLVRTGNPGRLAQLKSLIVKLDVAAKVGGNTRVVYLRNADATKLAEIIRGLLAAKTSAKAAAKGAAPKSFIQADEATNSLIINASDAVYNNLRGVIEKLDIRRAQVFVEALITEISSEKASEFGFQWAGLGPAGGGAVGGLVNFPQADGSSIVAAGVDPTTGLGLAGGLSLAFLGPEITLPDGTTVRNLAGLARALQKDSMANILSTPNILTLDNAEAQIVVAKNVPVLTGSYAQATSTSSTTANPFQTIERQDVGLTLKIKPQISEGGTVKLEIYQEVSTVDPTTTSSADLITNKRTLETTVVVDDQHTIVLGGLIDNSLQKTRQKVPVLGSIPLLGALFRYKADTKKKTNLMIFLRPTIIRGPEDSQRITADRYDNLLQRDKKPLDQDAIMKRFAPGNTPPPAGKKKGDLLESPTLPETETESEAEAESEAETETESEAEAEAEAEITP